MSKKNNLKREFKDVLHDAKTNVEDASPKRNMIVFGKLFILAIILVLLPLIAYFFARDTLLNPEWLRHFPEMVETQKGRNFFSFILFQIIQVIICIIPGQPIQIAASYMYGIPIGFLLSIVGAIIGTILTYYIAQILGKDAMHLIFGQTRVENYHHKLNSHKSLLIVFVIYLIPGLPKDLVSYVAGISEIDFKAFIFVSTVGRTPGMLGSLVMGNLIGKGQYEALEYLLLVTVIIVAICIINKNHIANFIDKLEKKNK